MSLMEGLTIRAVWASLEAVSRKVFGRRIRITSPRPTEQLRHAGNFAGDVIYRVTGTLKRLPKGHQIYLLRVDSSSGKAWPQGFYPVEFNRDAGTWEGRIKARDLKQLRVVAVVAPITSQLFFRYYEEHGMETKFSPLPSIPPDCINRDEVDAMVPDVGAVPSLEKPKAQTGKQ
jgi:hypothetical protein